MYLKYAKVRDVKSPRRANWGDAIDFFIPEGESDFYIHPGCNLLIPSGIKVEIPFGFALQFMNKSGVASKKRLIVGAELVDHGYSGEVHFDLHNIGNGVQVVKPGEKIVQAVILRVELPSLYQVDEKQLYTGIAKVSSREEDGFGSTGTK